MEILERTAEKYIDKWLEQKYTVALLGARQTGKTTILQKLSKKSESYYYNFDDIVLRNRVSSDFYFLKKDLEAKIGATLENLNRPILVLIDEAQKEPSVFEFLKIVHDNFKEKVGVVVSGSASLEIQKKVSESLAGRAQYVYLYPLSVEEAIRWRFSQEAKDSLFDLILEGNLSKDILLGRQRDLYPKTLELQSLLEEILVFGLLPGVWDKKSEDRFGYLRSIVSLYLEKDIRGAGLVKELSIFQNFLEILGFSVGGMLNISALSSQIQTSANTLRGYQSILESSFVLNLLPPLSLNPRKRAVKSPKAYFYDVGVANYLAGRETIKNIYDSRSGGGVFENIIIKSLEAHFANYTMRTKAFFWRDYQGREVDLVIKRGEKAVPVEITQSKVVEKRKVENLLCFADENNCDFGLVVYTGEVAEINTGKKPIFCLPWWMWV